MGTDYTRLWQICAHFEYCVYVVYFVWSTLCCCCMKQEKDVDAFLVLVWPIQMKRTETDQNEESTKAQRSIIIRRTHPCTVANAYIGAIRQTLGEEQILSALKSGRDIFPNRCCPMVVIFDEISA